MIDQATDKGLQRLQQLEDEAVKMALGGHWAEAEQVNRRILEREPDNVEALNRLGKALFELRRYDEAHVVYGRSLEVDPYNRIARKNRERLAKLLTSAAGPAGGGETVRERILPDLFISESGKSALVSLHGVAPQRVLQRLSRGEVVRLEADGGVVLVKTDDGLVLGRMDPRIGRRLAEFIQIGNRYAAAIAEVTEHQVKVFVREVYQHQRLIGRLSFPPMGLPQSEMVRPYIRELGMHLQELLESELDDDEDDEEEEEEPEEELAEDEEDDDEEDDLDLEEQDMEEPPADDDFAEGRAVI